MSLTCLKAAARSDCKRIAFDTAPVGDLVGGALSTMCVVHCLAAPAIAWAAPVLGADFLGGREVHRALAVIVLATAVLSLVPAFVRHRRITPLASAALGLAMILLAAFSSYRPLPMASSMWLTVGGGCLLTVAHVANWRSCRSASVRGGARSPDRRISDSALGGAQSREAQNCCGD